MVTELSTTVHGSQPLTPATLLAVQQWQLRYNKEKGMSSGESGCTQMKGESTLSEENHFEHGQYAVAYWESMKATKWRVRQLTYNKAQVQYPGETIYWLIKEVTLLNCLPDLPVQYLPI
jgi:hypothetical protein